MTKKKPESVCGEIRRKRPTTAFAADYENSRRYAIHLFCLECMGNQISLVKACNNYECFLWPYRANGCQKRRPEGEIPTIEEYKKKIK